MFKKMLVSLALFEKLGEVISTELESIADQDMFSTRKEIIL